MFGFDDFALLFAEAAPELLATEGTSATAAELAAQEAAREAAAAAATQQTAQAGIMQAGQMNPELLNSINGPGVKTAGLGNLMETGYWNNPVDLNPLTEADYKALNTEPKWAQDAAKADLNDVNGLDWSSQAGYEQATNPTLQDLQRKQLQESLDTRAAELPGSNIQTWEHPASTTQNVFRGNPAEAGFQPPQVTKGGYFNNGISGDYTDTMNPFERGMHTAGQYFDKASDWAEKHPYQAAGLGYYGAYKTGMLDQPKQEPIPSNYVNPYSMAGFRRSSPSPSAYRYTPNYAKGGIAGYAKGGRSKAESVTDFYDAMNPQHDAPPALGDVGIYYDMDPKTRYLDPLEAAQYRMSVINANANVQAPTMRQPTPMGTLNFKPVAAAKGGIMGYADGGAPVDYTEFDRLTSHANRSGPTKPDFSEADKFNPQNVAIYSSDHPTLSAIGRYLTSPTSTVGILANALAPESTKDAYSAWSGINPEAMRRNEADPAKQAANIAGLETAFGPQEAAGLAASPMSTDPSQRGGNGGIGSVGPVGRGEGGQDSAGEHGASLAHGGIAGYNLGGYAAGGNPRLLRGPGDGMSDNIPATINNRQPARLADGEFVVPADVVSHLGNGSTEAGAKQLHDMMTKVRKDRTGNPKQGKQINPQKYLPA